MCSEIFTLKLIDNYQLLSLGFSLHANLNEFFRNILNIKLLLI